ncbi:hypothetical protein J3F83DRAFT_752094 [Trichoderma novae-zelandiae]
MEPSLRGCAIVFGLDVFSSFHFSDSCVLLVTMSLAAYRNLLRAARIAFQGDVHVLSAAQTQIRQGFQENRALDSSSSIENAIRHAEDVATILRKNVVQGQKVESKGDDYTYKLRIHEHTERGDNDSILMAGNAKGGSGGGCGCN